MNSELQQQVYRARINKVMDYVQVHIEEKLSVPALASVACFSPFHFQRIFRALTGETVTGFIQRVRMEKAAFYLVYNREMSITEVAFSVGFESSASFARLFREFFGMSATQWRNGGYSRNSTISKTGSTIGKTKSSFGKELKESEGYIATHTAGGAILSEQYHHIHTERNIPMSITENANVAIEELPKQTVVYIRYIGPYKGDDELFGRLFGKLAKWAGPRGLLEREGASFLSLYQDDPEVTDESKLRLSVCVTVPPETEVSGEVGKMEIDGGTYAVGHFELGKDEFEHAWNYMYGTWLPDSGYQPGDGPCFERGCNNPETHPENKFIVDICIPVKPL